MCGTSSYIYTIQINSNVGMVFDQLMWGVFTHYCGDPRVFLALSTLK